MKSSTTRKISFHFCRTLVFIFPLLFLSVILARFDLKMADDGYYYLQIAWNAAHHNGFSFDGIHLTNGFQPLWQILLIPLFWLFKSKFLVPYIVVFIQTVLYAGSGFVLYRLIHRVTRRKEIALIGSMLWLCNPWFLFKGAATGMETGLFLLLWAITCYQLYILACTLFSSTDDNTILKNSNIILLTALLLALTVMARLDAIFLIVAVFLLLAFHRRIRPALYLIAPALLFFLVYFSVNYYYFGHIAPISGYIKSQYGKQLLSALFRSHDTDFIGHFFKNIFLFLTGNKIPPAFSVIVLSFLVGFFFRYRDRIAFPVRFMIALFVTNAIMLIVFYAALYENVLGTYKYYWLPLLWCGIFIIFILISLIANRIIRWSFLIFTLSLSVLFSFIYLKDAVATPDFRVKSEETPVQQTINFINHHLPEDAIIGSWDAGQIGYYSNKPVINLDGLVNNYDLLKYIHDDRLKEYLEKERITHLVNCDYYKQQRRWIEQEMGWTLIYNPILMITEGRQGTRFTVQPGFNHWAAHKKIEYYIFEKNQ